MMLKIDVNCDLGEGYGAYRIEQEELLFPYISSANIACGYHAGDPQTMRSRVKQCIQHGVAIGAHPGLPDLAGFGRREMQISPKEAYNMVLYQIGALYAFIKAEGGKLHHVKPHGALYNMAAKNIDLAEAIAEAVYRFDSGLILYGLSGSRLIEAGIKRGLRTASEVFADRTYQSDGSLTPRNQSNAVIHSAEQVIEQVLMMVNEGQVRTSDQSKIQIQAETLCIHGDGPNALKLLQELHDSFQVHQITISSLD